MSNQLQQAENDTTGVIIWLMFFLLIIIAAGWVFQLVFKFGLPRLVIQHFSQPKRVATAGADTSGAPPQPKTEPVITKEIPKTVMPQVKASPEALFVDSGYRLPGEMSREDWDSLPKWWQQQALFQDSNLKEYQWWHWLRKNFIHLLVVGKSGSGKTWTMRALAAELSHQGDLMIMDCKGHPIWGPGVIGRGLNFEEIRKGMKWVLDEMYRRYREFGEGKTNHKPLYVIVDEWPAVQVELKEDATTFLVKTATVAREVNIHVVIVTQSRLVKMLGIEGMGAVRDNYTELLLSNEALKLDEWRTYFARRKLEYPAAIDYDDTTLPVDRDFVKWLKDVPINPAALLNPFAPKAETPKVNNYLSVVPAPEEETPDNLGLYLQALNLIKDNPQLKVREVARQLYKVDDGGGRYSLRAERVLLEIYKHTGVLLDALKDKMKEA